jgi:hypothetical protein
MASKDTAKLPVETLTEKQAKAEHARLAEEIAAHDRRYYQEDAPTVSDAEYDRLRQRYAAIEARFPQLRTLDSLTQRVGAAPAARFAKVRHAVPMLSLDNAFADEDVVDFVGRIRRFLRLGEDDRSSSAPGRRSTACRCRCATKAANSSPPRRAATAARARTSPPISGRCRTSRSGSRAAACRRCARCAAKST